MHWYQLNLKSAIRNRIYAVETRSVSVVKTRESVLFALGVGVSVSEREASRREAIAVSRHSDLSVVPRNSANSIRQGYGYLAFKEGVDSIQMITAVSLLIQDTPFDG
ncbi:MAG: hypothetical protein V7L01_25450 [Nostoc sp.]|uniref:hypothetical protein n=1 Tax=Nostoc sp. TaxID=1180 RepID=UPI002FFD2691